MEWEQLPLVKRFPRLEPLAHVHIADLPTPVRALPELAEFLQTDGLWVKRDDLTNSTYGGNKVRKLEFLLGHALKEQARAVLTVGGIGTNHGLATAVFARRFGLNCHLVLFDQPNSPHCRANLRLCYSFGARLYYAPRYLLAALTMAGKIATAALSGPAGGLAVIPAGGSSPRGTLGFVNAALELEEQVRQGELPEPAYIFCALGSCGTLAGLTAGLALTRLRSRAVGVRVIPAAVANSRLVARLANRTLEWLAGRGASSDLPRIRPVHIPVVDGYFGHGYGQPTNAGRAALELAATHGLRLETTYTAKAFAAALDFCRTRRGRGPVLFWNTYSSSDLSARAAAVDHTLLPPAFHPLFINDA